MGHTPTAEISRSPVTGEVVFKLHGEAVSRETFLASAAYQFVIQLGITWGLAKALGISKRKAYGLITLANLWRELPNAKVDLDRL